MGQERDCLAEGGHIPEADAVQRGSKAKKAKVQVWEQGIRRYIALPEQNQRGLLPAHPSPAQCSDSHPLTLLLAVPPWSPKREGNQEATLIGICIFELADYLRGNRLF